MGEKSGQCLCGSVKFTATPKNSDVGVCHCSMCRRGTAGPFFAVNCGSSLEFVEDDKLGIYNSSPWGERGFCTECGTPIFWRTKDKKMNNVSVNAFEDLSGIQLEHEIFIDEKPDYYEFKEKTKQLTGKQVFELFIGEQDKT
jgi:hypothetical protein